MESEGQGFSSGSPIWKRAPLRWRRWKEILFGFTIAGFISVFVQQGFWKAIFLIGDGGAQQSPGFLIVLENALVAPVAAFFTFIGSMGNVPLTAMLWSRDTSFGGVGGVPRRRSRRRHRHLDPRQILRVALCPLSLRAALRLHGRGGHHRALDPLRRKAVSNNCIQTINSRVVDLYDRFQIYTETAVR